MPAFCDFGVNSCLNTGDSFTGTFSHIFFPESQGGEKQRREPTDRRDLRLGPAHPRPRPSSHPGYVGQHSKPSAGDSVSLPRCSGFLYRHVLCRQHVLHQDALVQELCSIVRKMGAILDQTKAELIEQKEKTGKQARAAATLRTKLEGELKGVKEAVKRKASASSVTDIDQYKSFKQDFDALTARFAENREASEASIAEVSPAQLQFSFTGMTSRWPEL